MANLRRFYTDRDNLRAGSSVKLPEEEVQHIQKSLRLQPDDHIVLFNGEQEYIARLKSVSSEAVMAEVVEVVEPGLNSESGLKLTIFQSLIRLPQFELVLQKVTELGVDNIIPLEAEFSQLKINNPEKRQARWQRIVMESCKQSERKTIPEIHEQISFEEIQQVAAQLGIDQLLLFTTPRDVVSKISEVHQLRDYVNQLQDKQHIGILIGPEGGFSPTEHKQAAESGIPFGAFNQNILRSETAGIVAVGILAAMLQ